MATTHLASCEPFAPRTGIVAVETSKRTTPQCSSAISGTLFLAAQLADLVWPTLVLAGVERFEVRPGITAVTPLDFVHYPYSHSLVAMGGWALLLGLFAAGVALYARTAIWLLVAWGYWIDRHRAQR